MKKQYVKPELYYENFELSTSIAACDIKTNHSKTACKISVAGIGTVFIDKDTGCDGYTAADGDYSMCYHVPVTGQNLFTS